jgi:jagged-1
LLLGLVLSNSPLSHSLAASSTASSNSNSFESNLCNSCTNHTQCSNLWCGLPNCLNERTKREVGISIVHECNYNEVCVPALKEACLMPPCPRRGDCRTLEQSLRTAPPKYPTSSKCWPNQAVLSENCSRINIILDMLKIPKGLSTESYCHDLRTLLGGRMLEQKIFSHSTIILICDIKSGTNDTIEVTVVSYIHDI